MSSDNLDHLLSELQRTRALCAAKFEVVASHVPLNPIELYGLQLAQVIDYLYPMHVDGQEHHPAEPPSNPERLKFDIDSNLKMMAFLDAKMRGHKLHIIGGNNGE